MLTILVADDNKDTRLILRQLFKQHDSVVVEADDGEQCLTAVQEWQPDVILLSANLPILDGYAVCAGLRQSQTNANLPVLMMVAGTPESVEAALAAGATDTITRPLHWQSLYHRVLNLARLKEIEALRRDNDWYHSIFANAAEGIYRSTPAGRFVLVNPALARMLGYDSVEEVLRLDIPQDIYFTPAEREHIYAQAAQVPILVHRVRLKKKNGEPIVVQSSVRVVRDTDNQISYYEGIMLDVSEAQRTTDALRHERALLRTLIDRLPDAIYVKDTASRFVAANQKLAQIMAVEHPRELIGRTDFDFYAPDLASRFRAEEQRIMESGVGFENEERFITHYLDGKPRWVALSKMPVRDENGQVTGIVGVGRDITQQVQSRSELQVKTDSLQAINSIADAVYHSLNFDTVVERALDAIMSYMHEAGAAIFAIDHEAGLLRRVGARGVYAGLAISTLPLHGSLAGLAFVQRDILISNDLHHDPRADTHAARVSVEAGIQGALIAPLFYQEQATGVLILMLSAPRDLNPNERETLLSFGKTIGLAMANAQYVSRMEQEIAERKRAQAAEHDQRILAEALRDTAALVNETLDLNNVLDRILTHLRRVIPHSSASIMLIEAGVVRIVRSHGYAEQGLDDATLFNLRFAIAETTNLRWMVENRQPLVIEDVREYPNWQRIKVMEWIRSHVSAPIKVDDEIIGFLSLDSVNLAAFTTVDAERLQAFADQAAIAIRNAFLYHASQQHTDELELRVASRTTELERERAQLYAILDAMSDGVTGVVFNEDGVTPDYRYINRALYQLTGYTSDEWQPQLVIGPAMPESDFATFWQDINHSVAQYGAWRSELPIRRKDNTTFDGSVTITRLDRADGHILGEVTMIRDISQEKALAAQKANFVTSASHELRTPITNLSTRLYLARRQPERMETHLQILEQVVDHMKNLVDNLLDLSRFERGVIELHLEDLVLQTVLDTVVEIQRPEAELRNISLRHETPSESLHVRIDRARMVQVMTNLITNAVNHTAQGGSILVHSARELDDGGTAYAVIWVRDTGSGIAPEHLPHIFKPFYQGGRHTKGMGLGLSISKEIVELHGGSIQADSALGEGTVFTVRLKLAETAAAV